MHLHVTMLIKVFAENPDFYRHLLDDNHMIRFFIKGRGPWAASDLS